MASVYTPVQAQDLAADTKPVDRIESSLENFQTTSDRPSGQASAGSVPLSAGDPVEILQDRFVDPLSRHNTGIQLGLIVRNVP